MTTTTTKADAIREALETIRVSRQRILAVHRTGWGTTRAWTSLCENRNTLAAAVDILRENNQPWIADLAYEEVVLSALAVEDVDRDPERDARLREIRKQVRILTRVLVPRT